MTRRPLRIALIVIAALLVVVVVAVVVVSQVYLRRPFPQYDGTVALSGLDADVRVVRDAQGVPQIYADTTGDLFRALGYVHAQDRFFEMDLRRHVTAGRMSELVGSNKDALTADTVARTLGWRRVAEQEMSLISPSTRSVLEAYSAGVNDYLRGRSPSQLSVNYTVLGLEHTLPAIEPWTPVDSLSWLKALAWDLKANYSSELDRARIYASVKDIRRVEQLFPVYPYDRHATIVPAGAKENASGVPRAVAAPAGPASGADDAAAAALGRFASHDLVQPGAERAFDATAAALGVLPGLVGADTGEIGSNSWVVSGRFTAGGKPLLANDPHLGVAMPGVWYQVGLHCRSVTAACPYDVSGFSMSGMPGVFAGHNQKISWGLTNMVADATDFYLERTNGGTYLRDGRQEPLQTREETIRVADAPSVTITVRSTVHGPLLSDVSDAVESAGVSAPAPVLSPPRGPGYAVSLAWTALTPSRGMDAVLGVDLATDFQQFRLAAADLAAPAQNFVYADTAGHIGYTASGMIPIRARTAVPVDNGSLQPGAWPMPGWDSAQDWTGYVPADRLPSFTDPADGIVVAANQAVVPPTYGVQFTSDWDYGYRSQRIRDLLLRATRSGRPVTVESMQRLQDDTRNEIAPDLVPLLLKTKVDAFTGQALDLLKAWSPDYSQPDDSAAAAYFNAVWATLLDLTFSDELPEGTRPTGGGRWFEVVRNLLANDKDSWWDDKRTPSIVETRDEIIRQALVQARLRLTSDLGKDPERWQWGRLHSLELRQTPLGAEGAPEFLQNLVDRGPLAAPGGSAAVDALAWNASSGSFAVTAGPSMRMLVDLGHLDGSRWVNTSGVSAHPGNGHYDDQLDTWLAGRTYPWAYSAKAVEAARRHELVLRGGG